MQHEHDSYRHLPCRTERVWCGRRDGGQKIRFGSTMVDAKGDHSELPRDFDDTPVDTSPSKNLRGRAQTAQPKGGS